MVKMQQNIQQTHAFLIVCHCAVAKCPTESNLEKQRLVWITAERRMCVKDIMAAGAPHY